MKIYTRAGDTGDTMLYGGQMVRKNSVRVDAYGTVDEANALLGLAVTHLDEGALKDTLLRLQNELFVVGSDLATPLSREEQAGHALVPRITEGMAAALETLVDCHEDALPPLTQFILPGGTPAAAVLHLSRTVLRRAERCLVALVDAAPEETNAETLRYLNRLSDLLFVLARAANAEAGVADVPWVKPG